FSGASPSGTSISANPQYLGGSDFHLMSSSLCIDVGTATGAPSTDRDGASRPLDGDGIGGAAVDMGAYEYVPSAVCGNGLREGTEVRGAGARNGTDGAFMCG